MKKFSKAGIDGAQQTRSVAQKTATSDQFWRFFRSTQKSTQKLILWEWVRSGKIDISAYLSRVKYPCFGDVKVGYNRFGVFAVIFGLMFCLIFQAWLPAWAYKAGEFPGKGSRDTWMKANDYARNGKKARSLKEFDEAIESFNMAISLYPFDGVYFFERGLAFEARNKGGDLPLAERDFRRASRLLPEEWQVWECIGHVLYEQGRKKECGPMFLKAISCNPPALSKARIEKNMEMVKREIAAKDAN